MGFWKRQQEEIKPPTTKEDRILEEWRRKADLAAIFKQPLLMTQEGHETLLQILNRKGIKGSRAVS